MSTALRTTTGSPRIPGRAVASLREIIERSSCPEPNTGCWLWLLDRNHNGYGRHTSKATKDRFAHRISFLAHREDIPVGMFVLHRCDTPACVNPDHLFLGTKRDNAQDMIRKGRRANFSGENSALAKLTPAIARDIRAAIAGGESCVSIRTRLGISRTTVYRVAHNKSWLREPS